MSKLRLRELWESGQPTYGGWLTLPGSVSAEIMGRAGWDWCCIDTQHGLIGYDAMVPMLQALSAAGCPPVVRVEWNDPATIMKTLDAGAEGVIIPMVNSVDEARAAVAACRYAPEGSRSWGPMRARMLNPEYSVESGRDPICAVMIETVQAIGSLEQILDQVSGLDAVFVGPADLSASMGGPIGLEEPSVQGVVDDVLKRTTAAGKIAGVNTGPRGSRAREYIEAGVLCLITGAWGLIGAGMNGYLDAARAS